MRMAVTFAALGVLFSTPALALPPPTSTVTNLQTAFEEELNAAANFRAFASKAEQEGFARAARLLRALALGEEAHAQSHAQVMRSLGAQPHAAVAAVEVRSTRENLEAAIARETFGRDAMYPTLLGEAREIRDAAPLATLGVAMFVERAHVKLLQQALQELEAARGVDGELCVSRRSGYVTRCAPAALACQSPASATLELVD